MCEFIERMTKACSLSRLEDNARSCTQVPRGGHADAASNRKSWTDAYYGQTNVLSRWLVETTHKTEDKTEIKDEGDGRS